LDEAAQEKLRQMDEKMKKIEEMERMLQERERAMREASLAAEERAALMEVRLREFEEKTRADAEEMARQQEEMLQNVQAAVNAATSAINFDQELVPVAMGSQPNTGRHTGRGPATGRTPRSARKGGAGGLPTAPPSGRSARDPIPLNTPRMKVGKEEWVQLWDDEWNRFVSARLPWCSLAS
jgi:hypothetical protein